ncbi:MAG: hypothetical protein ACRDGA_05130, partial [Bacteroidota bacterium]
LHFKTFNGEAYTDFEMRDLPRAATKVEQSKGKRNIYRKGDSFSARAGNGGPELSFNTLNGDIYIVKQK